MFLFSFRSILELEKIDYGDYMMSICGDETLREVSAPGRIGNMIFLSNDDRFVIKTLRKSEVKVRLSPCETLLIPENDCLLNR